MAEDKKDETKAAEKAASADADAKTFPRARLIAEASALFGQPSHVVAGALSVERLAKKGELSVAEVKRAIGEFLDHEVQIDHPHPDKEA